MCGNDLQLNPIIESTKTGCSDIEEEVYHCIFPGCQAFFDNWPLTEMTEMDTAIYELPSAVEQFKTLSMFVNNTNLQLGCTNILEIIAGYWV